MIVGNDLQQLRSHTRIDSRVQDVSEISRDLKIFDNKLNGPVIVLSQLSRAVEHRQAAPWTH